MVNPLARAQLGELFWSTQDGVAVVSSGHVTAWNPAAERIFGVPAAVATAPGFDLPSVLGLSASRVEEFADSMPGIIEPPGCGAIHVTGWRSEDSHETVLLFADVSTSQRVERGLRELNGFAGRLLRQRPSLEDLLTQLSACARTVTDCAFAAVILVLPGSLTVTHVTVDNPLDAHPDVDPVINVALSESLLAGLSVRADKGRLTSVVGEDDALRARGRPARELDQRDVVERDLDRPQILARRAKRVDGDDLLERGAARLDGAEHPRDLRARHERAGARFRDDVARALEPPAELAEPERRVHRHRDEPRPHRAEEGEDEIVALREDERDAVAFSETERL